MTGEPGESAAAGRFPYRLIATDLDGTLLRDDGTVSPRTRAALEAACGRGAEHIVVTGRAVPWTRDILDGMGYKGLAVCGQGAQVYDTAAGRMVTSVTLDRGLARAAVARIEAETGPLTIAASQDGTDGQVLIGPGYREQGKGLPAVRCADAEELWAAPLNKLYLQHPALGDDELAKAARAVAGDLVSITMAGEDLVEMLPLGLSKAKGLAIAARRLGVSAGQTIAFGDMPNDVPMFGWAAHGVAMADAHPELLAVADEVTASNDDDGIAVVLERLLASS
ncbi:HAD family hydrolase [Streptomyces marispadix]|uniref:Cof-type HAD-IIB family hydrolase n=1 Tax=Streptomyces marispadix TaxID=2922868 RepID=A0ABS9SZ33_9ACTN|nr:HAD family hydrolase [Streptomyces marispadix]MCH6161535.1 Cof-type HAD-IIB family hydrolase [Streptomyces marispadix]